MAVCLDVSAYLALGRQVEVGEQTCPECGQRLGGWGGYWRWLRGSSTQRLWIRRGRCSSCRRSHALLPDFLLDRRLDEVAVFGRALVLAIVIGCGMRRVAEQVNVPMTTARDWRRRFRVRAPALTVAIVAIAVHLDPSAVSWTAMAKRLRSRRLAPTGNAPVDASVSARHLCGGSGA